MATMLELIQQATAEMGLAVPTYVAGNTSSDVVQLLALLNAMGYELTRQFEWQGLSVEYRFTTEIISTTGDVLDGSATISNIPSTTGLDSTYMVTGSGINQDAYVSSVVDGNTITISQAATATGVAEVLNFGKTKYAMPADFDRQTNRTHFDKSKRWEMLGPETAQEWQWLKSSYISTGPRIRYRILGGYFQIWPVLNTPEYLGFEYTSKYWAKNAAGEAKAAFTVDTDTCIFPDRLMVLGLKHKYFQVKGFGDVYMQDYMAELAVSKATDHGAPTLSFAPTASTALIGWENIPDSSYGS